MKAVSWILLIMFPWPGFSQNALPDTPQPQNPGLQAPLRAEAAQEKARPAKVLNKKFIAMHAALFGSVVFDSEVTHQGIAHHKCVEAHGNPYPSRGQLYAKNLSVAATLTGIDYVLQRLRVPFIPYAPAAIRTYKHIHGGMQWFTEGCY